MVLQVKYMQFYPPEIECFCGPDGIQLGSANRKRIYAKCNTYPTQ